MTFVDWFGIVLLTIYSQGLLLSIAMVFVKRDNKRAIYFLSLFTLIFSLAVIGKLLLYLEAYSRESLFHYLHTSLLLGMGPAIYFYFKFQLTTNVTFSRHTVMHFLPMCAELLFYMGTPSEIVFKNYNLIYNIEQVLAQISVILYTLAALRQINRHIHQHGNEPNSLWYKRLVLMYMIGIVIWILYVFINVTFFNDKMTVPDYYPMYIYAAFVVYAIAYSGLLRPLLIPNYEKNKKVKTIPNEFSIYAEKISAFMETHQPYLNPDLRIKDFSHKIGLPQNTVSEVINHIFKKSFSDYINTYRINAVKPILLTSNLEIVTIESIAFENGFKSRSTFHTTFKKIAGCTPTQFVSRHK